MNNELDPLKQYELVTAFTDFVNNGMAKIAHHLGIDKKITTIVSRHSFSSQLSVQEPAQNLFKKLLGILKKSQYNSIFWRN